MTNKTHTQAGVALSDKEIAEARKDGAKEYIKEGSGRAMALDTGTAADPEDMADAERFRVAPHLNTTFIAPLLDLSEDELEDRLTKDKEPGFVDFEHAKGLLALERAGRNRTSYVKLLCKVIGVKSPVEVTSAGPAYTNDTSNVTAL